MKKGQKVWVTIGGTHRKQTGVIISTEKVAQGTTVFVRLDPVGGVRTEGDTGEVITVSDDEIQEVSK